MKMTKANQNEFIPDSEFKLNLTSNEFEARDSIIMEKGLFTNKFIPKNTNLGPSLIHKSLKSKYEKFLTGQYHPDLKWDYAQTTATRYINHSANPNLKLYTMNNDNSVIYSRSIKDIKEDEELTLDYAQTALIAEDCTDPDVINYYCGILNLSQEKFLAFVKGNKK